MHVSRHVGAAPHTADVLEMDDVLGRPEPKTGDRDADAECLYVALWGAKVFKEGDDDD